MFGFIKSLFFTSLYFFTFNVLKCVSTNSQECKVRQITINIKSNKPLFYPYIIKVNKCSGSCNNVNDAYAKLCVLDFVKNTVCHGMS